VEYGRRAGWHVLASILGILALIAGPAAADDLTSASPLPLPAATDTPTPLTYCPSHVDVDEIKGHPDEALFTLWSEVEAGQSTGSIVFYSETERYEVLFVNAVLADIRKTAVLPTLIVVKFPYKDIESAYIGSLLGNDCPVHAPYERSGLSKYVRNSYNDNPYGPGGPIYPSWKEIWNQLFAEAATRTPLEVSPSEPVPPPSCAIPYRDAYTVAAPEYGSPPGIKRGTWVAVQLELSRVGSILDLRVDHSAGDKDADAIALAVTARGKFAPPIYRCEPVSGAFLFILHFD
jgi:hypothetical protein